MRVATAVVCVALIGAALGMASLHASLQTQAAQAQSSGPSLIEFALSSMTMLYGGLLGVFALAVFTDRRLSDRGGQLGLAVGALAGIALFLHESALGELWVAWAWWIPISASLSAATIALSAPPLPR
jgi:hypothetical protein